MPGSPLKRARAAARTGQVIGWAPLIPGEWDPVAMAWQGPISPGTISRVAALYAAGATARTVADSLRIPRMAGEWFVARDDVRAEAKRLDGVRVRGMRLFALGVLSDVMGSEDAQTGDKIRAAGTLLTHTPATGTDEPEWTQEMLEDYLAAEHRAGRLQAMLERGLARAAEEDAAEAAAE